MESVTPLPFLELVVELDHTVRSGEPLLGARKIILRSVRMIRHPRDSHVVSPSLSLVLATPESK